MDISLEYEKIREHNRQKHKELTDKVYLQIPRIKEIDIICADVCKEYLSLVAGGKMPADVAVSKMQKEIDVLTKEKQTLLKKMGLTIKDFDTIYTCEKCKDKGYVNGKWCDCYYRLQSKQLLNNSNINIKASNTFDKFDLSLYSDKEDKKFGFSPRDNANSVKEIAMYFAQEKEDAPDNLYLYGATGLGKTFTADCIAHCYIEKQKSVFYMSAPKLFSALEDYKFAKGDIEQAGKTVSSVENCELLIIDDLGTEFHTPFVDSCLFEIINSRMIAQKKTIISSNLSPKELSKVYSDRIASRILGGFEQLLFIGEDIRVKKYR
ncbi:MAG: ATP-binding protein [Clostridia bacterium]|nr:ATP-binding protein [Clostridia bacterium]